MIIVHQPKNGMVQVETESVTDDLQATGSHQLSLSSQFFGRPLSEYLPGIYDDDGAFISSFEDFWNKLAETAGKGT